MLGYALKKSAVIAAVLLLLGSTTVASNTNKGRSLQSDVFDAESTTSFRHGIAVPTIQTRQNENNSSVVTLEATETEAEETVEVGVTVNATNAESLGIVTTATGGEGGGGSDPVDGEPLFNVSIAIDRHEDFLGERNVDGDLIPKTVPTVSPQPTGSAEPSVTPMPSVSAAPTMTPTISPAPTVTPEPTTDETTAPTITPMPSSSSAPSNAPTVSPAPTTSPSQAPSFNCFVNEDGSYGAQNGDPITIDYDYELETDGSADVTTVIIPAVEKTLAQSLLAELFPDRCGADAAGGSGSLPIVTLPPGAIGLDAQDGRSATAAAANFGIRRRQLQQRLLEIIGVSPKPEDSIHTSASCSVAPAEGNTCRVVDGSMTFYLDSAPDGDEAERAIRVIQQGMEDGSYAAEIPGVERLAYRTPTEPEDDSEREAPEPEDPEDGGGLAWWAILLIILAILLCCLLILCLGYRWRQRRGEETELIDRHEDRYVDDYDDGYMPPDAGTIPGRLPAPGSDSDLGMP